MSGRIVMLYTALEWVLCHKKSIEKSRCIVKVLLRWKIINFIIFFLIKIYYPPVALKFLHETGFPAKKVLCKDFNEREGVYFI